LFLRGVVFWPSESSDGVGEAREFRAYLCHPDFESADPVLDELAVLPDLGREELDPRLQSRDSRGYDDDETDERREDRNYLHHRREPIVHAVAPFVGMRTPTVQSPNPTEFSLRIRTRMSWFGSPSVTLADVTEPAAVTADVVDVAEIRAYSKWVVTAEIGSCPGGPFVHDIEQVCPRPSTVAATLARSGYDGNGRRWSLE
jgi:hypothetical protein